LPPELLWRDRAYAFFPVPLLQNLLTIVFLYGIGFAFIFVFLALVNNKPHFFTAWGQRTLAIYLLHVYLVAPLVEFTQFEKNPLLHLILLVAGSGFITYLLSHPKVTEILRKTLARILHFIMPNKNGDSS
jgi:fucose 4-O-acetylase-like acetyltransferase